MQEVRPLPGEQKSRRVIETRSMARQTALINGVVPDFEARLAKVQPCQVSGVLWRMTIQAAL